MKTLSKDRYVMEDNNMLLTLTAWIVTKYYWENASSAIASSQEHLNGQENAGRAGVREVRGSKKPGGATTLLHTLFRVR